MSKVTKFEEIMISGEDVLIKSTCIKPGVVAKAKAAGLHIPDDIAEKKETKDDADGEWTTPEIVKVGSKVSGWKVGQLLIKTKQEYPLSFLSPDGDDMNIGTVRYSTFPARLIDMTVEKDNYEL